MKAIADQVTLLRALSNAARIACTKSPASHANLARLSSDLSVTAIGFYQEVRTTFDGTEQGFGELLLNPAEARDKVALLAAKEVYVETADNHLVITGVDTKRRYRIDTQPVGNFPESRLAAALKDGQPWFESVGEELSLLFANAGYATSLDPSRPALFGMNIRTADGGIIGQSCDGLRLTRATTSHCTISDASHSFFVPFNAINDMRAASKFFSNLVTARVHRGDLLLTSEAVSMLIRPTASKPLDTDMIFNQFAATESFVVDRDKLSKSVHANLFDRTRLTLNAGALEITSDDVHGDPTYFDSIDEVVRPDKDGTWCASTKYLSEAIAHLAGENITVSVGEGELFPIQFSSESGKALVMTMADVVAR